MVNPSGLKTAGSISLVSRTFAGMCLILAGCMVGPDFHQPPAPNVTGYTVKPLPKETVPASKADHQAQSFLQGADIPAQWWTLFHSEPLNKLIEQALKANPDLQAAQAALRQAKENVDAAKGTMFPSIDGKATSTRQKVSGSQFGRPGGSGSIFTLYNTSVNVSYGFDLFGGVRRQIESIQAKANVKYFQLEATYLSLTSNVVTAAIQEASLRAQIAATQQIITAERKQLDMIQHQLDLGSVSMTDVLTQKAALTQTQTTLPPLQKQLAQIRHQLAALSGRFPSQAGEETFQFISMKLPLDLPVSLPSKLVQQRPDVRAAEAQLHDASAQIGVATANFLPQFTINGNYGSVAIRSGDLFAAGTGIWSLSGNLLQPLFHGGTLIHQRRAAIAAYDQAAAQYRSTVLIAFQNVADSLRALQTDADAADAQSASLHVAADRFALSRKQFKAGAISYLSLLNSQRSYQQARILMAQTQATHYADTAALFQALGGGWWNRKNRNPKIRH